jgi:uncharacterized protein (TIGR00369 family)
MSTHATKSTEASATLQRWLDEEAALLSRRDVGVGMGVASPAQLKAKSGLEAMRSMMNGESPFAPIGKTMDFMLVHVDDGSAVFQGTPKPEHFNPLGTVHGGWFATLLDSALGCSVHTKLPAGRGYTTAELSVNIVRALTTQVPRVRAIGRVLHCGRQLATAEAQLIGPDGTLYAHGTTTCLVFEMK